MVYASGAYLRTSVSDFPRFFFFLMIITFVLAFRHLTRNLFVT